MGMRRARGCTNRRPKRAEAARRVALWLAPWSRWPLLLPLKNLEFNGRSGGIRTHDPQSPRLVR